MWVTISSSGEHYRGCIARRIPYREAMMSIEQTTEHGGTGKLALLTLVLAVALILSTLTACSHDGLSRNGTVQVLLTDAPLDLQQQTWQTVKIPLGDQAVQSIVLEGQFQGTFYLDDIRLVPQALPTPPTAVL